MNNHNTIGVDLAKNVIYVSVVSPKQKLLQSKEVSRTKFKQFLATQKPALVAFEACATAHYWSRAAQSHGHKTKILPGLAVAPFRQGHKTDKNDARGIAQLLRTGWYSQVHINFGPARLHGLWATHRPKTWHWGCPGSLPGRCLQQVEDCVPWRYCTPAETGRLE